MDKKIPLSLSFDDVLLIPQKSEVLPKNIITKSIFSRNIRLNIPVVSAAMDTVTESKMAIAVAREGGIGIIHKNMSIERQAEEIDKVKRYESGMITNPVTLGPKNKIHEAIDLMHKYEISGIPIIDKTLKIIGIITKRDIIFLDNLEENIEKRMTKESELITAEKGTTFENAKKLLQKYKIEKLPIIDDNKHLIGLITIKDIIKKELYPMAAKDKLGRLFVGAALGVTEDVIERANELVKMNVDCFIVDTAHGHSSGVINVIKKLKSKFSNIDIIVGNVATAKAVKDLALLGVDAIKVGVGPGSICTTRVIAGVGVAQFTAIYECSYEAKKFSIPVIADGGIKYSGDIVKALAAGASSVMIGGLLAGTDESPGSTEIHEGRKFKIYRGMGSIDAMKAGSSDRYFQSDMSKFVPEGVVGKVPYSGTVKEVIYQLTGGIRSGMGYVGCKTINKLQKNAKFIRITSAGLRESHPHDIIMTKEPPNYEPMR
ncbi:IMP dehydrogenase [candidate division WOR-3 bacterium]|jgi:IMP dehydrogenase|nr:IMP dehydrogenase [candidate division WOR-3 bacterium]